MNLIKQNLYFSIIGLALIASSCSKKSDGDGSTIDPTVTSKFVIAGTSATTEQTKNYLFVSDQLNSGSITVKGNGYETDGSTLKIQNNKAFSFKYNQGNDGFTEVFKLNGSNALEKVSSFSVKSVNVFLPFKDQNNLLAYNIGRSLTTSGTAYWINTNTNTVQKDAAFDQKVVYVDGKLVSNYYAFMYGFFEVGSNIYAVYAPTYGGEGTQGPNNYQDIAFVSIFDKDMKFVKTISDKRMPYIGRYYTGTGLAEVSNGDVYVFSNGLTTTANNHSAFLKITNQAFDANYYFDVEAASKGMRIHYGKYLGDNKFILMMVDRNEATAAANGCKLAIVDVVNKSFDWVSGVDKKINYQSYDFPLFTHNGKGYLALQEQTSLSVIYEIDPVAKTGKRGLELTGITAITGLGILSQTK